MTTPPKIPAWITQPERVPGEPLSRIEHDWPADASGARWYLTQAITAFDAERAEVEEWRALSEANGLRLGELNTELTNMRFRAEAAEAECARLRKELAEYKPQPKWMKS